VLYSLIRHSIWISGAGPATLFVLLTGAHVD